MIEQEVFQFDTTEDCTHPHECLDGDLGLGALMTWEAQQTYAKDACPELILALKHKQSEKENVPELSNTPDNCRKSRSVSKDGLQAACLFEQFKAESSESKPARAHTPPKTPTGPAHRVGFNTPPETPPRPAPLGKPPTWSPHPPRKTSTPSKGFGVPCTPPRSQRPPRMVHNPYRLPGTPSPRKTPTGKRSPLVRASPKPRTPTRTRLALMKQNTPSPGLSPHLSLQGTPQPRLSMALVTPSGTPSHPAIQLSPQPMTPDSSKPAQISLSTAAEFLQYSAVAEHLPPSLQTTYGSEFRPAEETPLQFTYCQPFASSNSPRTYSVLPLGQYLNIQYAHSATSPLYPQMQRTPAGESPFHLCDYSPQPLGQFHAGASPAARHVPAMMPGSPPQQTPPSAVVLPPNIHFPSTPSTPQNVVPTKIYALVEFKRGRIVQYQSSFFAQPGEYLLVEGDEGEDMGMVVNAWVAPANSPPVVNNSINSNRASSGRDVDPVTGDPIYPKVIRPATAKEVQCMHNAQAQAEIKCAEVAKHKVLEHQLMMRIVDAEYQFDRKKLTFYYDAAERVDFRDLIRDLYKLYRARIWMSKIRPQEGYDDRRSR